MDIFDWLDREPTHSLLAREDRLHWAVNRISAAAVDNRHAEVDALCAEALPLARKHQSPWLEIYLRHWRLQSTIFKRLEIKENLREAVDLVERAHRDDARGCPQSVCATQDLCAAYGRADGAAYVAERLEASRSTLERIDPSWPCWRCISAEYAGALVDAGRFAEGLAWLEENFRQMKAVDPRAGRHEYIAAWVDCLVGLDRLDDALEASRSADNRGQGEHFPLERAIEQAWIHLRAGRLDTARERLPGLASIEDTPEFYTRWTLVVCGLLSAGNLSLEPPLLGELLDLQRTLRKNGALGLAARSGEALAETLLALGWLPAADALLEELTALAAERVRPAEAAAALQPLRARLQAAQAARAAEIELGDDLAAVQARFAQQPARLSERLAALERWPGQVDWILTLTEQWDALAFPARAEALVEAQLAHAPAGDPRLLRWLGERHLTAGRLDAARGVLTRTTAPDAPPALQAAGRWLTAGLQAAQGDAAGAQAALEALIASDPGDAEARTRLASLYRAQGDLDRAQAQLDALCAVGPTGPADWDRMVIATRRGDWAAVRHSAARLGLPLTGEGPVSESWEPIQLAFLEEGENAVYYGLRTGPVTAEIHQPAFPGEKNHEGDTVVFEPRPLNPDADGVEESHCFPVDAILTPGRRSAWPINGQRPPPAAIAQLEASLPALEGRLFIVSDDLYRVRGQRSRWVPGFYALLTVPDQLPRATLCATLARALSKTRLTWLPLLDPETDAAEHKRQRALAEAMGI